MDRSPPPAAESNNLHFLDYWRVIVSRKEIILAMTLLVSLTAAFVTSTMEKRYMAVCRVKVAQDNPNVSVFGYEGTRRYDPYFLLTEMQVLESSQVLGMVVDALNLAQKWGEELTEDGRALPRETAIDMLKKRVSIEQERNTSNINIAAHSTDREEAARIANQIAHSYNEYRLTSNYREIKKSLEVLEEEMNKKTQDVDEAELAVERIREEHGLTSYGGDITAETTKLRQLEGDLITYRVDMIQRKARLDELSSLKEETSLINALLLIVPDRNLTALSRQLMDSEINLNMLLESLGENHPDVRRVRAGVIDLRTKITENIEGIKAGLRTDYAVARAKYEALFEELEKAKRADIEAKRGKVLPFERAQRELRVKRTILAALQARIAQEGVNVEMPRTPVDIFEQAQPPLRHYSPRYVLNLVLGLIAGLGLGVGFAFFIEYLDTSVKTVDDIERYLGTQVIGVIPQKVKPLNQEGPESPHMESYRVLRTNLQFANKGVGGGAFAVCSGGVGEGKSTTLFNLAFTCAKMGDKVLIVDSDMRRPVQHTILGMSNRFGLTNVLMRDVPIEETIKTTSEPNLHFLPSGRLPRTSVGLLDTQRVRDLIKNLKARYDYVFFDSPPIMGVSDASIIASEVDGVLLVVQYRKYPRVMPARAKRLIENVGGNIVGVVLNNINILRDDYYYYYHSYYSHYADPDTVDEVADSDEPATKPKERF